jgi:hypothetical protein
MKSPYRTSLVRFFTGASLLVLALVAAIFLLPGAEKKRKESQRTANEAKRALEQQKADLSQLQKQADDIHASQACLKDLLGNMATESIGQLQWQLHRRLFELAQKHAIALRAVKYSAPTREGAKGTDLEALDVEFTATGIYQGLKPFMLDLEGSKMPFAVVSAKLEESPEGARLSVTLRAFRRSGATTDDAAGEGA